MEKNVLELFGEYYKGNFLIRDFLSDLLDEKLFIGDNKKKIAGTCLIFYYFYNKLYEKLGLYDFQGKSFIKKL